MASHGRRSVLDEGAGDDGVARARAGRAARGQRVGRAARAQRGGRRQGRRRWRAGGSAASVVEMKKRLSVGSSRGRGNGAVYMVGGPLVPGEYTTRDQRVFGPG